MRAIVKRVGGSVAYSRLHCPTTTTFFAFQIPLQNGLALFDDNRASAIFFDTCLSRGDASILLCECTTVLHIATVIQLRKVLRYLLKCVCIFLAPADETFL